MMKWMRERLSSDKGFTLIELMVVVLIIAVLIAIAIPSFIGFRDKARDREAQSNLRNALVAEKAIWTDTSSYSATIGDLQDYEPSLTSVADAFAAGATGGVELNLVAGNQAVCMYQQSASGKVFGVWDGATGATAYGKDLAAPVTCAATAPGTWTSGW